MDQPFTLTLTDPWKSTALVVGSLLALLGLAAALLELVGPAWPAVAGLSCLGLLGGWVFWFIPKTAPRYCALPAMAVLDADGLTVHYPATETTRYLAFADLASFSVLRNEGLTVRPRQGPALRLHLNYKLHPEGLLPLLQLQEGFRRAVAGYRQRHPGLPPIRELGFLARPGGTVGLVVLAAFVGWLGWRACRPLATEGAWGGFLLLGLLFGAYALAWGQARRVDKE